MLSIGAASECLTEIFDAELNEVYDILITEVPRPVPGTQVMIDIAFIEFVLFVFPV